MSVHGYQPYRPQDYTQKVITAARNTLVEYKAWESPMTIRQIFYRLVAEYNFDKTEKAYNSLIGYIARSRRAYQRRIIDLWDEGLDAKEVGDRAFADGTLIPFGWIRDERGHTAPVQFFETVSEFQETVEAAIDGLQMDRQKGQDRMIELWCEAAGMVPLMKEIAQPFGIRVSSGGGYDSVTAKHKLALRVVDNWESKAATLVMHVGDFDPSGEGMFDTLTDDVGEMVYQLAGHQIVTFKRIGLTEQQVIDRNVETAPPKPTDSRMRGFLRAHPTIRDQLGSDNIAAQLEALTPPELRELITNQIESYLNRPALETVEDQERELRDEIRRKFDIEP